MEPQNVTELSLFLELCNFFRQFASEFSRIAAPLTPKLHKDPRKEIRLLNEKERSEMKPL